MPAARRGAALRPKRLHRHPPGSTSGRSVTRPRGPGIADAGGSPQLARRPQPGAGRPHFAFPATTTTASAAGAPRMRAQDDAHQSGLEAATRPLPLVNAAYVNRKPCAFPSPHPRVVPSERVRRDRRRARIQAAAEAAAVELDSDGSATAFPQTGVRREPTVRWRLRDPRPEHRRALAARRSPRIRERGRPGESGACPQSGHIG